MHFESSVAPNPVRSNFSASSSESHSVVPVCEKKKKSNNWNYLWGDSPPKGTITRRTNKTWERSLEVLPVAPTGRQSHPNLIL
jgi:hypothetical protein